MNGIAVSLRSEPTGKSRRGSGNIDAESSDPSPVREDMMPETPDAGRLS
jgi:hypothetical protein